MITIGIDITSIQGPHRLRGIGSVVINFINHLSEAQSADSIQLVLYAYSTDEIDKIISNVLQLDDISYEVRPVTKRPPHILPGLLGRASRIVSQSLFGDSRVYDTSGIDIFMQLDQNQALPRTRAKKVLIAYDIIPYVLESIYMPNLKTSVLRRLGKRAAIKNQLGRSKYKFMLKRNIGRANRVIAISEHTRQDFINVLGVRPKKISTVLLGVPDVVEHPPKYVTDFHDTSWGPFKSQELDLTQHRYILYLGGIDQRRKILEVFAAYNNLRARGHDIKLLLAGDILNSGKNIPTPETRQYALERSYTDGIHFLGFTSETEKAALYKYALAVVYPSMYEGFGLPVLEAMQYGTPVIAYRNSSIAEVAQEAAMYATDFLGIVNNLERLQSEPELRADYAAKGKRQAAKFSWRKTTEAIIEEISNL